MTRRWDITTAMLLVLPMAGSAQAPVTAFIDVSVVPMDQERTLAHQTVLIQGDQIMKIGPVSEVPVPDEALRIDGRGKFLLPGLADMHAQLPGSLTGDPPPDSTTLAVRLARGRRILLRYLAVGVVTVRMMHGRPDELLALRAEAARGSILSPRVYAAAVPFATARRSGLTRGAAARLVEDAKRAGFDVINLYDADGPFGTVEGNLINASDSHLLDTIITTARQVHIPLAGHYTPRWVYQAAMAYRSSEHLVVDSDLSRNMGQRWPDSGAWSTPTLVYVTERAGWMDTTLAARAIQRLRGIGAPLLLGSAGWGTNPAAVVPRELAALVAAGLTPYEALLTGTRNAAAYFGMLDSIGTIAEQKRADLVLLSGNPLEDIKHVGHPVGVMLAGRWLPRAQLEQLEALLEGTDGDFHETP